MLWDGIKFFVVATVFIVELVMLEVIGNLADYNRKCTVQ